VIVARIVVVIAGVALVVLVLDAAIRNFMLPRASRVRLTAFIGTTIGRAFRLLTPPTRPYAYRDRILAFRAPLTLLAFQATWMFLVFVGFTAIFWGVGDISVGEAARFSGSALFTLGFASPVSTGLLFIDYGEALIGLTLLALLISYLPTIYAAFSKREFMVAKLAIRGGFPPSPWGAIEVVYTTTGSLDAMDALMWHEWEEWFIDLSETHTSLVILNFYRSPDPNSHWISAARIALDTAALRISAVDLPVKTGPAVTIRSGFIAMRAIARQFRIEYPPDPQPGDPISVTREQFEAALDHLAMRGIPIKADRDEAWRAFAGWRVNYDMIIEHFAQVLTAAPNPWDDIIEVAATLAAQQKPQP
jgi:hypothetical protein